MITDILLQIDTPVEGQYIPWMLGILAAAVVALFWQLLASKNEQIKDLKDQINTLVPEFKNLSTAVRDLTTELRTRPMRGGR